MKILIIGTGRVAEVMSSLLEKEKFVEKITCASDNPFHSKIKKTDKINFEEIDASDVSEIVEMAENFDLIINASLPYFNESIIKAALKVGANYQDLCSNLADLKTPEQLKFDKEFKEKKLIGLINTGVSPGITNLLIGEIAEDLEEIEDLKIRVLEEQESENFVFSWSPDVTLDEINSKPLIIKNGKFDLVSPLEAGEKYDFGPLGKKETFSVYGDEISTIGRFLKIRNADYRGAGKDMEFAVKLKESKEKVFSKKDNREEIQEAFFASIVEGKNKTKKIKYLVAYPKLTEIKKKFPHATYISYPTAIAAVSFTKIIDKIKNKGIIPPELIEKKLREEIKSNLLKNKVIIKKI